MSNSLIIENIIVNTDVNPLEMKINISINIHWKLNGEINLLKLKEIEKEELPKISGIIYDMKNQLMGMPI
ncbi:MAG: hypothetical protein ACOCP8_04460 [archaeon]